MPRPFFDILRKRRCDLTVAVCLAAILLVGSAADLASQPVCAVCGGAISGQYYELDGRVYHVSCFTRNVAPRCGVCGQPLLDEYVVQEGKTYHRRCFETQVALRCAVCNGIIEGQYLVDSRGNPYHGWHAEEVPICRFCGRLTSDNAAGGAVAFDDKNFICRSCRSGAVDDRRRAKSLLAEVRAALDSIGISLDIDDIDLRLADRSELSRVIGVAEADNFGVAQERTVTRFFGTLKEREYSVIILKGLPRWHFTATAAHELMHLWLYRNGVKGMDRRMAEGSCDYASILVLRRFDDPMAAQVIGQIESNPADIYGEGCRRVKRLGDTRGVAYWLEHLRFDPDFPLGY